MAAERPATSKCRPERFGVVPAVECRLGLVPQRFRLERGSGPRGRRLDLLGQQPQQEVGLGPILGQRSRGGGGCRRGGGWGPAGRQGPDGGACGGRDRAPRLPAGVHERFVGRLGQLVGSRILVEVESGLGLGDQRLAGGDVAAGPLEDLGLPSGHRQPVEGSVLDELGTALELGDELVAPRSQPTREVEEDADDEDDQEDHDDEDRQLGSRDPQAPHPKFSPRSGRLEEDTARATYLEERPSGRWRWARPRSPAPARSGRALRRPTASP